MVIHFLFFFFFLLSSSSSISWRHAGPESRVRRPETSTACWTTVSPRCRYDDRHIPNVQSPCLAVQWWCPVDVYPTTQVALWPSAAVIYTQLMNIQHTEGFQRKLQHKLHSAVGRCNLHPVNEIFNTMRDFKESCKMNLGFCNFAQSMNIQHNEGF